MALFSEAKRAISLHLKTRWRETPYYFENERALTRDNEYVRLIIRSELSIQNTLGRPGNRHFTRTGRIITQIFTPADQGIQRANTLVDAVILLFEAVVLPDVVTQEAEVSEKGTAGSYYRVDVDILFFYEQLK